MIETLIVMILICLIFCGIYQISVLFNAKEIVDYSASRATRAKAVGFNKWMVKKVGRVGMIPNAGKMIVPTYTNIDLVLEDKVATLNSGSLWDWVLGSAPKTSGQYEIEKLRIPEYLGAKDEIIADNTLDYNNWDSINIGSGLEGMFVYTIIKQDYPLTVPMHKSFYDADEVNLKGKSYLERHYDLYLEDMGW